MGLLVVDIGNSNTRFAYFTEDGRVVDPVSIPTAEFALDRMPKDVSGVAVASVVPSRNSIFNQLERPPFFLSAEAVGFIDFSNVDAKALGADRIANAVALAKTTDLPAICVDCGTALTIEAVDADGVFFAGPIAPGRLLAREALRSRTAKLPMVDVPRCDLAPPSVFASDTRGAILAGCDLGALGMVREFLGEAKVRPGFQYAGVYAAGGDSSFFAENIQGVENVGPDFTLLGLGVAYMENRG